VARADLLVCLERSVGLRLWQTLVPLPLRDPERVPELTRAAYRDGVDVGPDLVERIRDVPLGTWVQLASDSGRVEPAKASWVSPISSRLMFVNRRGIRVLVASPEELAAMVKLGKLRLREGDNAFDDALHQVASRLQAAVPADARVTT
jgi:hypothetical protein